MNDETGARADADAGGGAPAARALPWGEVLAAGVGLVAALKRSLLALVALFVAEARVARASVVLVVLGGIALVAFAVALWACIAALIGWALFVATHSVGAALGILVVLHLLLVVALWLLIRRALRQAGFPLLRAELRTLRHELRAKVGRSEPASPPATPGPSA